MFRSLDYYMLVCMIFVFGALAEAALVGMTDYRSAKKFRKDVGLPMKNTGVTARKVSMKVIRQNMELRERTCSKKMLFQEVT